MIISILNQKGGVGKTTLAVNLARSFTLKGHKTLLVDTDSQGSALNWHERSNGDLLDMVCLCKNTLEKDVAMFEDTYEYIFIDGIPRVSNLTMYAINCSDAILIPVQPSPYDIWATEDIVRHVKGRQIVTDGMLKASFIVSRKIANTNIGKDIEAELAKLELPVFKNGTCQRIDYATSVEKGLTVLDKEFCGSKACYEIDQISNELKEMINGANSNNL